MTRRTAPPPLPWLEPGDPFPDPASAWAAGSPAPGLLAAGASLDVPTLERAYRSGVFPWFSEGQPILWWSTDPRMVLRPRDFRLQRSLRKTIQRLLAQRRLEIRMDTRFNAVIQACASGPRKGQDGTWIVPDMIQAYGDMHSAGLVHSVETWIDGQLAGGLHCVAIGRAVFGESMFTRVPDASKIALAGLVAFCLAHGVELIDCQQDTAHLASLGAQPIARTEFLAAVRRGTQQPALPWQFDSVYWREFPPLQGLA